MTNLKKLLLLVCLFFFSSAARAADVYISQSGAGTQSGADCSNAKTFAFFNSSATSGNIYHTCGTFTAASPNTIALTVPADSLSIVFETGAILTSPAWSFMGAINLNSHVSITVDGGTNGIIRNTANGSGLANHIGSSGVACKNGGCSNAIVKNLAITNIYVHTGSGSEIDQTDENAIQCWPCTGAQILNNTITNVGWALNVWGTNQIISGNTVTNMDHGMAVGPSGAIGGMTIHDNHFGSMAAWDTSANTYHHDGIHMWGGPAPAGSSSADYISSCSIYNNTFDGDPGVNTTGFIFLEGKIQNCNIYNNVFNNTSANTINCMWFQGYSASFTATGNKFLNNYIRCGPSNANSATGLDVNSQLLFAACNNVVNHGWSLINLDSSTTLSATKCPGSTSAVDYNSYEDLATDGAGNNAFAWHGSNTASFTSWKSSCSCDSHSLFATFTNMKFSATGHPTTGSPSIGTAANLTTFSIPTLNSDAAGVARGNSWDIGAYQFGISTFPNPPTGLTIVVF